MKGLNLFLSVCVLSLITACGDAGLGGFKKVIEKNTGVPVTIATTDDDKCASEQAMKLLADFNNLNKNERQNVAEILKSKFKSITLNKTVITKTLSGPVTYLQYIIRQCSTSSCWNKEIGRKILFSEVATEGVAPVTKANISDGNLIVATEAELDKRMGTFYATKSVEAYDLLENTTDQNFTEFRQTGLVFFASENNAIGTNCASPISLKELLAL